MLMFARLAVIKWYVHDMKIEKSIDLTVTVTTARVIGSAPINISQQAQGRDEFPGRIRHRQRPVTVTHVPIFDANDANPPLPPRPHHRNPWCRQLLYPSPTLSANNPSTALQPPVGPARRITSAPDDRTIRPPFGRSCEPVLSVSPRSTTTSLGNLQFHFQPLSIVTLRSSHRCLVDNPFAAATTTSCFDGEGQLPRRHLLYRSRQIAQIRRSNKNQ